MSKIGRPAKTGAVRTPSGQISRAKAATAKGEQPSYWARVRDILSRQACDPNLGTELGRLFVFGKITAVQFESGRRYRETVQRALRTMGLNCLDPGDAPSPSGRAFPMPNTDEWDAMTDSGRAAAAALKAMDLALGLNRRAVEHVCVWGLHLEYEHWQKLEMGLDALTSFFNSQTKRRS